MVAVVCLFFVKPRHAKEKESVLRCAADQNKSLKEVFWFMCLIDVTP